jgi:HEAT repeat protein
MTIAEMLSGGDRRSPGRSGEAVALVEEKPELFAEVVECLWHEDPVVRMRAADAMEKATVCAPELLRPFKRELLGLMEEATQQEVRWHLALMVSRLALTAAERRRAVAALRTYLEDRSSIVKTFAMQGLADLAVQDGTLREETVELLRVLTRTGTAAMRARGRKLLQRLG